MNYKQSLNCTTTQKQGCESKIEKKSEKKSEMKSVREAHTIRARSAKSLRPGFRARLGPWKLWGSRCSLVQSRLILETISFNLKWLVFG